MSLVGEACRRLDAFIASRLKGVSRRRIHAAIREGRILVDGRRARPGFPVRPGTRIEGRIDVDEIGIEPTPITLPVLFEDDHITVIDKPAGLLVQATAHERRRCVAAALLARYGEVPSLGGPERAGIVHRLDREASGVMVCGRTLAALKNLAGQFRRREVEKEYWALVVGEVQPDRFVVRGRIALRRREYRARVVGRGGKEAITEIEVRRRWKARTWLRVRAVTGRPHQIRVHLAHLGHPIVGDAAYGTGGRLALHAERLRFRHPVTGRSLEFRAPVPKELRRMIPH